LQQVYGARKVRGCTIIDAPPFFESAGREEREPREKIDGEDEGSPPPRDSEATTTTVFWGDDEGPVVMVWDGMTQEEQVIAQTVISGEKDWVIWRTKPTQSKPGENAAGDRIYQEATVFLEEFGTKLEGAMPRGSKSQKRSENGSGGGFTRRKDWYRLNDIRTAACGRDMEIWVPKSGSVPVPDRIEAVWEAWRRDSPKDECTVKLEGPEKEWWAGTELGLLRAYHFPGHVTASDGSVGSDCMGAGFTWMDSSLKRCGSERIGRDEEGTSSGRAELGGYAAILKRTPDTQDLVTATDSEVLCRLVRRWIGQGGKASLSNTADADILEFIIGKLRARIAANARTFLVKIKAHRGEPLNERADDLADEGKTLAKAGDSYPWTNRTTRLVYSYYDRATHQWKKGTWSKTIRNAARRGAAESLMEDRLQKGADKWRTELFKPRHEFWEGEQIEPVCPSEKWETVASGQWMQKSAWNRMVTRTMREQPHTTPVTTTWTADFLTREGEGRKAMGDWLHDKLIPWKARRRLLQTNSGTFPCESRLQKWGKHSDGICGLCKRCREMGLGLLGGKPARGTTGHLQSSVCRLQAPAATGAHNQCFQQVQEDMSKARSTCKDWDFVSKGTEISVGRFLIEYFTPVTLGEQHQGALSDEDVAEVWLAAKSEAISKVRRTKGGAKGAEAHCPDVKEVEKTFWLSRPDGWVINKKTKRIIMLEFKRASDTAETYYSDMKSIAERQHTPILEGLNALAGERGWVVEVLPLVAGQRSVREKEWLESMKTFGIGTEDGKRIIYRLGSLLLSEHEKLFGSYWRQVFGPPSSLMHLLGKGLAVRASNSL
jgi:ribonuclease HI